MTQTLADAPSSIGIAGARSISATFVLDPHDWRVEVLRYAVSAAVAAIVGGVLILAVGGRDTSVEATETEHAVLVDLPAALSSAQPASEAQEGPRQEASDAVPAAPQQPPEERQPETEPPKLVEPPVQIAQPKLDVPQAPVDDVQAAAPLAPPKPIEPPKLEPPKPVEVQPPDTTPPPVAAPSPALAEQAPTGSDTPIAGDHPESDEGRQHASARAITAWQRSLVGRLETAKRALPHTMTRTAVGTVQVAFAVDRDGHVVSEKVARSSGSSALDDTALSLVRRAAPFPTPPTGTGDRDLSFIVPIHFRH